MKNVPSIRPRLMPFRKIGTDMVGRFHAEAYGQKIVVTRMFSHTGPRRGDVFAESSFAKQIAMIERELIPPVIKTGNLKSLRTWSDVRDAVRAYYMLVTVNPIPGEYYNVGGNFSCSVGEMLDYLLSISTRKDIKVEVEQSRLRPLDADLQVPDTEKFRKSIQVGSQRFPLNKLCRTCWIIGENVLKPDKLFWFADLTRIETQNYAKN